MSEKFLVETQPVSQYEEFKHKARVELLGAIDALEYDSINTALFSIATANHALAVIIKCGLKK